MTATFDIPAKKSIISVAEIDGTQALFLMPSPAAVAKEQRDHYTAKIAPDARPKCLPFISADNDVSGAFLFNQIAAHKKNARLKTGALWAKPHLTKEA